MKPGTRLTSDTITKPQIWPGILIVGLVGAARIWANSGDGSPTQFFVGLFLAPLGALLLLFAWWLFLSRVSIVDRILVVAVLVVAFLATAFVNPQDLQPRLRPHPLHGTGR